MKKVRVIFISIIVLILSLLLENKIYAANSMNLKIIDNRPYTNSAYVVKTLNRNRSFSI